MSDRLRVGIVGTGAVAQLVHLPFCSGRNDVELVAVADKDPGKARALAERFGVERVLATDALLQADDLDAVILCTPNHLHEAEAVAALEAGKHVLVERPLALTADGCRQVIAAARAAGCTLGVGMSHRFRPDVAAARAFVEGGELGGVYAARVAWMNRHVPLRATTWRQRPEQAGGGAFVDLGVQAVDLLLWLLDGVRVKRVSAVMSGEGEAVEEDASVLAETENGVALSVEVSWRFLAPEDSHYARVLGASGSVQLPPLEMHRRVGGRALNVTPEQSAPRSRSNRYMSAHRRQLDHFLRAARGFTDIGLPEEQIHVMEIVRAAYRSAREGREVEL
ncbi:MAG: Gfo/Idh/MocA family oxidoreductase [Longimicrobiales bacterium]|nr:Gfo/Idh/MocA family oxidoreductase [Longimicrobiales bacterium]